jgi:hypothetical protein
MSLIHPKKSLLQGISIKNSWTNYGVIHEENPVGNFYDDGVQLGDG